MKDTLSHNFFLHPLKQQYLDMILFFTGVFFTGVYFAKVDFVLSFGDIEDSFSGDFSGNTYATTMTSSSKSVTNFFPY